jgi:hypothetical protein
LVTVLSRHGFRRSVRIAVLLSVVVVAGSALLVTAATALPTCTDNFTGSSGGDWGTASNWTNASNSSLHAVPTSSDIACWGPSVTVVVSTGDTADSIQGGVLDVTGGTLDLANGSDDSTVGNVTLGTSSTLDGPSPLTIDGSFAWTGSGDLNATITQVDRSGTCFTINGTGQAYIEGGSVQTSCQVTIDNPGTINTGGATLTTTSTLDFGAGVVVGQGGATFTAAGVIGPGSGTYGFDGDVLVLTGGTTTVTSGEALESASLIVQNGQTTTIDSGGTVEQLGGGTGQVESGGTVTGAGSLEVAGGTLDADSGGTLTSGISVTGGTLTVESGSTTGTSSAPVSVSSGTLAVNSPATTGNVTFSGGAITGSAQLSVDGSFTWSAQAQLDADIVQSDGSGTCFTINGTGQAYLTGGSIQTSCQVTIDNPGFITAGNATVTTTSTLDFAAGLDIPVNGGDNATFTAAGVAANAGPTYGTGGDNLVLTGGTTTVAGSNTLDSGPLTIEGAAVLQDDGTVSGAPTLTGGTLGGTGVVAAPLTNTSGTVAPGDAPGTLTVTGDYTQASGGTLAIAVDGTGAGQHSELQINGNVTLGGTLELEPDAAYAAAAGPGDRFTVVNYLDDLTNTFTSVSSSAALPAGESFSADYVGDSNAHIDAVVGAAQPPANSAVPQVTGSTQVGDQLSTTNGSWTNSPSSFTYQWKDCTGSAGTSCTSIGGAMASTYTLTTADIGKYVIVVVTAHNAATTTGAATGTPVKGPVTAPTTPPPAPTDTTLPAITGSPDAGATLTCNPGTWTGSPTFTYGWAVDGTTISGAATSTYTVIVVEEGHKLTCVVNATNAGGSATATSTPVTIVTASTPPQPVGGGPTVTGTPLPGHTLTCNPGTWTGSPTFTYQWNVGSSPVTGATTRTYAVTILDEGQTITCTVDASNGAGSVKSTSGKGVVVAQKGTLTCPKPAGTLTPSRIGPLALGEGRTAARHALKRFAVTHYGFDDFCLFGGWGIRGGYRATKLVLLLTANPFYKLDGITPGLTIASVRKRVKIGKAIVIGLNDWYVAPGTGSNDVFKVRHGVVQEIGIATKAQTATPAAQERFLAGFRA